MDVLYYDGSHSVIFDDKHTWLDWHLVPTSKPVIPPPELVENFVDIPGSNGQLDLTEVLNGFPLYKSRTAELEFLIDPAHGGLESVYQTIANQFHGRRSKVILTDDPEWYYEGRVVVSEATTTAQYSTIKFKLALDPFKLRVTPVPGLDGIVVSGMKEINVFIGNSPMRQIPRITSSSGMIATLIRDGETECITPITEGVRKRYPGIVFGPGMNKVILIGSGIVSIEAREGSL